MSRKSEFDDSDSSGLKRLDSAHNIIVVNNKKTRWINVMNRHRSKDKLTFAEMNQVERTDHARYLWKRVAIVCNIRGLLPKLVEE